MPTLPWTPWHKVVKVREDLRSGELPLHLFAADLYDVLMQNGERPVYEQPEQFFALTYPTFNLRELVKDVVLRLAGKNDKAVRLIAANYGGGKTHTLITLRHLVQDPDSLPAMAAVGEFIQAIGQKPPRTRVAGLCFDKLDVETGMDIRSPVGQVRRLKQPWSILAYQIAGDEGLMALRDDGKTDERMSAPAELTLRNLLSLPLKQDLSTLVLMDEVLMYAREKVGLDPGSQTHLENFFQYLTNAATKVPRCCVVASLLASDLDKNDKLGRQLVGKLYDVFGRQREEVDEPVGKSDVAEVLRRRFFTPESIQNRDAFKQHVVAALKGISELDDQTKRQAASEEERFLNSYPFHPDLTEVFYTKWTSLDRFQRTRGVLRTFALALRDAEKWDNGPLISAQVFLTAPSQKGLCDATGELVTAAETEEAEGRKQAWVGILDGELSRARTIQSEAVGLKYREIEQAVLSTFLHSQPVGQSAKTRDLIVLLGATRTDKINLEKGLIQWAQRSYWLDDLFTPPATEDKLPGAWRLGNRPNLTQMHQTAAKDVGDPLVNARLLDEIPKVKSLTLGASAAGAKVHTLPQKPKDIDDDGLFHYAILGPSADSESGKPSAEAKRFLDEKTGPENPRVFRNALVLLVPSKDGMDLATKAIRDYLAWEVVSTDLLRNQQEGKISIDAARMQSLTVNVQKAKSRIAKGIEQAWCIVVTVSDANEVQAFKISISDEGHFTVIKNDPRSRIQETPVTAEALLLDGPYNLWQEGDTARRVKDLAGAFAQMPQLPKMLKTEAIVGTLLEGCEQGTFVLRLSRPDKSFRTWWRSRPDEAALKDPGLELVLCSAAELAEITPLLLAPNLLAQLWPGKEITLKTVTDYFDGSRSVQVNRGTYEETVQIPKAGTAVISDAIEKAVAEGVIWLQAGPASLLGETVPKGLLSGTAKLCAPPDSIAPANLLPDNLPAAWANQQATGLSISTALSQTAGSTLPWKTVKDAINAALQARFIELAEGSTPWPCDFPNAQMLKLKVSAPTKGTVYEPPGKMLVAKADFEPSELQDLADLIPQLLEIKAKAKVPMQFQVSLQVGDGKQRPSQTLADEINVELAKLKKTEFRAK